MQSSCPLTPFLLCLSLLTSLRLLTISSGQESFLLLSLFLTAHQTVHSTLYLASKNTGFASLVSFLGVLGAFLPAFLLFAVFYLHFNPFSSETYASTLQHTLPRIWSSFLRFSSPVFILCEGLASLLVVQALGKTTKQWIEEGERDGRDSRGFMFLVGSSSVYVGSFWALIRIFPPSPLSSPYPPFLLGIALTTTLFLTLIGFRLRRTNFVETALVFAYVIWSVWLLDVESGSKKREFGEGWLIRSRSREGWADGLDMAGIMGFAFSHVGSVVSGLFSALPLPLLIALVYRITVLHAASRIILFIRRQSAGWDPSSPSGSSEGEGEGGFWDGRRLGEEPPSARATTILLSYRRAILISVYTHLLLLDDSAAVWRWASISLFLLVWAAELVLDGDEDDGVGGVGGGGLGLGGMNLGKEWKVD
ncbi:ICE2-domain-containing protein [Mrakia frigida]|uniref:Ice2p n=1 Tax=Mrakia frigida TaxID=29902 RepID=UPI003FCC1AD1